MSTPPYDAFGLHTETKEKPELCHQEALTPGQLALQAYLSITDSEQPDFSERRWEAVGEAVITAHLAQIKGPSDEEIDDCYDWAKQEIDKNEIRSLFTSSHAAELEKLKGYLILAEKREASLESVIAAKDAEIKDLTKKLQFEERDSCKAMDEALALIDKLTRERDEAIALSIKKIEQVDRLAQERIALSDQVDTLRQQLEEAKIWLRAIDRESKDPFSREQAKKALAGHEPFLKPAPSPAAVEEFQYACPPVSKRADNIALVEGLQALQKDTAKEKPLTANANCPHHFDGLSLKPGWQPTVKQSLTVEPPVAEVPTPRVDDVSLKSGDFDELCTLAMNLERETIALKDSGPCRGELAAIVSKTLAKLKEYTK